MVAVGLQPNDDIAKRSDLEIDSVRGGVMVNPELEAKPDIWVVGVNSQAQAKPDIWVVGVNSQAQAKPDMGGRC